MEAGSVTPIAEAPSLEQTIVLLGNSGPMMQNPVYHPELGHQIGTVGVPTRHIQQSVTRVEMWQGFDDKEFVDLTLSTDNDRILAMISRNLDDEYRQYSIGVAEVEQIFPVHSHKSKPDWIWSNDVGFAAALAHHFGNDVPVLDHEPTMLLTNAGRDAVHAQHLGTSAQPAAFNYIGLTANVTAPVAGDTTLAGEIATAGGGLIRAQATYAHTAGTNSSTLTKTFTANGTDVLPVTIAKIGVFNATTAGTMSYETALGSTATLSAVGDNVTVTETVNAG